MQLSTNIKPLIRVGMWLIETSLRYFLQLVPLHLRLIWVVQLRQVQAPDLGKSLPYIQRKVAIFVIVEPYTVEVQIDKGPSKH